MKLTMKSFLAQKHASQLKEIVKLKSSRFPAKDNVAFYYNC